MLFGNGFLQLVRVPEFRRERMWRVSDRWQAAAHRRALRSERGHDDRAARPHAGAEACAVSLSVVSACQKVEDGAVMPDIDRLDSPIPCHIGLDPGDLPVSGTEPRLRSFEGGARNVKNRHARDLPAEQIVHEAGIPAPNIEDSSIG